VRQVDGTVMGIQMTFGNMGSAYTRGHSAILRKPSHTLSIWLVSRMVPGWFWIVIVVAPSIRVSGVTLLAVSEVTVSTFHSTFPKEVEGGEET
jgi:hypothetical protein